MGEFKLDTSGSVGPMPGWLTPVPTCNRVVFWEDLTPFEQGYVEALFASTPPDDLEIHGSEDTYRQAGFSDLAPEALDVICKDCAAYQEATRTGFEDTPPKRVTRRRQPIRGAAFWRTRQLGHARGFPPVAPYLNDAGKVCLRVSAQQVSTPSSSGEEVIGRTSQPHVARDPAPAITDQPHSDGEG